MTDIDKFRDDEDNGEAHFGVLSPSMPFTCSYCSGKFSVGVVRYMNNWSKPKRPVCTFCVRSIDVVRPNVNANPEIQRLHQDMLQLYEYCRKIDNQLAGLKSSIISELSPRLEQIEFLLKQLHTKAMNTGRKSTSKLAEDNANRPWLNETADDGIDPDVLQKMHRLGNQAATPINEIIGGLIDKFPGDKE